MDAPASGGVWARQWGFVAAAGVLLAAENARAPTVHLDFAPLYGAALLAREGRLDEAYAVDPTVGKDAQAVLTEAVRARGYPLRHCLRYLHPPVLAGLILPLTGADYAVAATLFRALSLLALVAAALSLSRIGRGGGLAGAGIGVVLLLLFDPVRRTLDLGQTNLFVMAILCAGVAARRAVVGGFAIGFSCLIKTYALMVPLALFLVGGDWRRRATWAFLTLAAAHAAAYLAWPDATFAYLDMMRDLSGRQFLWPEQQSLAALIARLETGFRAEDVSAWVERVVPAGVAGRVAPWFAVAVATGVVAWTRWRRLDGPAALALAVPAGLLASPILHSHYGAVLAIPAVWLAQNAGRSTAVWLGLAGIGLQALPLHQDEARAWVPLLAGLGAHWVFVTYRLVGVVLVLAGVVVATRRPGRAPYGV